MGKGKYIKCDNCEETEMSPSNIKRSYQYMFRFLKSHYGWIRKIIDKHEYHFCSEECYNEFVDFKEKGL